MSLQASNAMGVKVEPKFLRDPSALESISSALYGLSSYVAHNIPSSIASLRKVAGSAPEYQFQSNTFQDYLPPQFAGDVDSSLQVVAADNIPKKNVVIYAAFDEIQSNALGSPSSSTTRSVLVLGYPDGFQIWDVTNPENIFELISIKDAEKLGEVMFIKVITHNIHSLYEKSFPLIALVCKPTKAHHEHDALREGLFKPKNVLNFLSLRSHEVVKTIEFENEGVITSIKCNDRAIVVALSNPSQLHILSTLTLEKSFSSPLTDVASHPITRAPIYSLGPRLLAYATTSSTPKGGGKKNGAYMLGEVDEDIGGTGRYQEVAKDVARGVAKEVVNGVKLIGDYSYQTISAYFSNGAMTTSASSAPPTTMPINIQSGGMSPASRGSPSPQPSPSNGYYTTRAGGIVTSSDSNSNGGLSTAANGVDDVIGAIMIRDIGVQALSVVAHFQPHTHPVGYLSFNPSGTFLFSTSTQGHQFHIFEILGKRRRGGSHNSIKHIYGLSRGYTDASVGEGSVGWSEDSRWCAVATGRGTTHVFAINPYGGPAHIPSHIQGWVANAEEPVMLSNQSPVVRIKPRTPLPPDPTDPTNFPPQASNINDHYNYVPFDSNPPSAATSPVRRPGPLTTNGNINNINVQQIIYNGAQPIPFHQAFSFLRKPPSICLKFLSAANGLLSSNSLGGNLKRNAKRRSSPSAAVSSNIPLAGQGRRRTQSWTQSSIPGVTHGAYLDFNEEEDKPDRIGYQDVLSFHPSGILTLHRIWTEGVLVGEEASQGKDEGASTIGIAGVPLTRSATTVANMGKVLVDGAVGVVGIGMGMAGAGKKETVRLGEPTLDMRVSCEDVAEWNVLRDQDWAEVKRAIEPPMLCKDGNTASKRDGSKNWLAHAEIATHTTSRTSLPPPLWLVQQFTFKTYHSCYNGALHKGEIPQTKKVEIKRKKLGEEGLGKGLEDISENISSAMESYLNIPYSSNISITGNVLNGYGSFGELAETTPLSFEDAFHIQATDYQNHNIPVITTTSSSSPSASPVIPDLINLVTPSPTSSPQFVSKPSPMSLSNVQTLSNPTAPSPLQRPNTFSRSASLSSVKTTTSTAAFSDDMEFISKEFSTDEAENGQESFIFDSDNDNTVSSDNGSRSEVIEEKEVLTYG